jgi:hypothetical protein
MVSLDWSYVRDDEVVMPAVTAAIPVVPIDQLSGVHITHLCTDDFGVNYWSVTMDNYEPVSAVLVGQGLLVDSWGNTMYCGQWFLCWRAQSSPADSWNDDIESQTVISSDEEEEDKEAEQRCALADKLIGAALRSELESKESQAALSHLSDDEVIEVCKRLPLRKALVSPFANYFVQALITTHPNISIPSVVETLQENGVVWAARHKFACRVMCRIVENLNSAVEVEPFLTKVLTERCYVLSHHEFSRHVIVSAVSSDNQSLSDALFASVTVDFDNLLNTINGCIVAQIVVKRSQNVAKLFAERDDFQKALNKKCGKGMYFVAKMTAHHLPT